MQLHTLDRAVHIDETAYVLYAVDRLLAAPEQSVSTVHPGRAAIPAQWEHAPIQWMRPQ